MSRKLRRWAAVENFFNLSTYQANSLFIRRAVDYTGSMYHFEEHLADQQREKLTDKIAVLIKIRNYLLTHEIISVEVSQELAAMEWSGNFEWATT